MTAVRTLTEAISDVLHEHHHSGTTTISSGCGDDEHTTGAQAWCYCGGLGPAWLTEGPAWHGTFNLPADDAAEELRTHVAQAIVSTIAELIAEAVEKARAEERERIATRLHDHGQAFTNQTNRSIALREAYTNAARIARGDA